MAGREKLIVAQAIVKSLIESGMNNPDEDFEITAQQYLRMIERLAGCAIEDAPVARSVNCLSEVGGANAPAPVTSSGGDITIVSIEDKGKYVRVQAERNGRRVWASAWDKDASAIRTCGVGGKVSAEVVQKDKFTNLKNVTVLSAGSSAADHEIPF